MKTILPILLINTLVMSCAGSRSVEKTKVSDKTIDKTEASSEVSVNSETKVEGTSNVKVNREAVSFSITGDGNPYEVSFGGLVFKGSASINFGNEKQSSESQIKYTYHNVFTYKSKYKYWNVYQHYTVYDHRESDRKSSSFWLLALVCFGGLVLGLAIPSLWKKLKASTWQLKIWERIFK